MQTEVINNIIIWYILNGLMNVSIMRRDGVVELWSMPQMTQPTNGGAVTADTNCCANCVETSRPQQWVPDLSFFWASRPCGPARWLGLLLMKASDAETTPGPITTTILDLRYLP